MVAMQVGPKNNPILLNGPVNRSITLIPDSALVYPELWLSVYVSENNRAFSDMFVRARCYKADNIREADLVVFTGGADVDPALYGEKSRHPKTRGDPARDKRDQNLYEMCIQEGIPMLGVCRGAQFLHVMNGGKLFQDVDGHVGDHSIVDENRLVIDRVSSTHHQMCIQNNRMRVLATARKSQQRSINGSIREKGEILDVEAFLYEDTLSLGIQGHPEFKGYPRFTSWVLQQIQELIVENPRVHLIRPGDNMGVVHRIKPDFQAKKKGKK